jgi:hypothetical protein
MFNDLVGFWIFNGVNDVVWSYFCNTRGFSLKENQW